MRRGRAIKDCQELIARKQLEVAVVRRKESDVKAYWDAIHAKIWIEQDEIYDEGSVKLTEGSKIKSPSSDGMRMS